jgi:uracil-DNA glycosylase
VSTEQLLRKHQAELDEVVGRQVPIEVEGFRTALIPLPHPSGASVWHRTEPGKGLLEQALPRIAAHPAWREILV